jgi:hypothetical protein
MAINIFKILRSTVYGNRPTGAVATGGAPYVNFAEKQFGVVDGSNAPQDLIGVPYFSASASYAVGAAVNFGGKFYIANTAVTPAAFNAAQWTQITNVPVAKIRLFTATGTYTPTAGISCVQFRAVGGGGGSGGVGGAASQSVGAGGGGSGAYSEVLLTAAQIGASLAITIGAAGVAGGGAGAGGAGGQTSIAALLTAPGGGGGFPASGSVSPGGGSGGAIGTGDFAIRGNDGGSGSYSATAVATAYGGPGAGSMLGAWTNGTSAASSVSAGVPGKNYGSGGGGAACMGVGTGAAGAVGTAGCVIATEYFK